MACQSGLAAARASDNCLTGPLQGGREHEFELAKIQRENAQALALKNADIDREVKLGKIAANRQVEVARIESGMVDVKAAKSGDPSSYSE